MRLRSQMAMSGTPRRSSLPHHTSLKSL
jgi:hypothetical protein